ncbi:MAG: helix-turn-helix domain-containing protein [Patescibacteria group bacterium]
MKIPSVLLQSLGLTPLQAAVYIAALELGQSSIQDLSRKSGVKRTSIYNFITDLKTRGLITQTRKKKRLVYSAVHPEQLLEIEKTRLTELERLMPELTAIYNKSESKPRVTFYERLDGTEEVYADMLSEKKPILVYEDLEHMKSGMRPGFYSTWPGERARRGIPLKSISRDSATAREFTKHNIKLLRQTKFMTAPPLKTEINIYGDKVALMSFRQDAPFCVLIEDRDIAQTLRTTWEQLWERLGPVVG